MHQDLLAFLEQVSDERNVLWLIAPEAPATSATPSAVAIECRTRRTLCIGRSCGGSTHLGAGIHRAAYRFGLDDSFSLGLGLIKLRFYFIGFLFLDYFCSGRLGGKRAANPNPGISYSRDFLGRLLIIRGSVGFFLQLFKRFVFFQLFDVSS